MAFLDGPVLYWGLRKVEWVKLVGALAAVTVAVTVAYQRVKSHGKK
ncbi:MAG: hypothetical protein M3O85_04825 [Acidobacteriota bacterium]|nr:hypothetical protein [Acidobacteriota bacterium]